MKYKVPSKEIDKGPSRLTDKMILIIGPRRLQNELMASFLNRETGAKCIEGEDIGQIRALNGKNSRPMLILWDCLDNNPGIYVTEPEPEDEKILSRHYVAIFNVTPDLGIEGKALDRGVRGFFYRQNSHELFPKGVRSIFKGELWVSREILNRYTLENRKKNHVFKKEKTILTPREIEILSRIALGAKNEEIAAELFISPNTVKTHIYNIFKKINVPNRLQATLWAAKHL